MLAIPEILVIDNGPAFASGDFEKFVKVNGIRHVKTAPYQPALNGLAVWSVQIFKGGIIKDGSLETKVSCFFCLATDSHHRPQLFFCLLSCCLVIHIEPCYQSTPVLESTERFTWFSCSYGVLNWWQSFCKELGCWWIKATWSQPE